jgi:hypothetical protein
MIFEIESEHDINDLVEEIVRQSNNITDEDLKAIPEKYRDLFKSILSNIVFVHQKKGKKHYIKVLMPIRLGSVSKQMIDRLFGLSSKLKRIFKEANVDAKVRLL